MKDFHGGARTVNSHLSILIQSAAHRAFPKLALKIAEDGSIGRGMNPFHRFVVVIGHSARIHYQHAEQDE